MKNNAKAASKGTHDLNPIIRLWHNLTTPQLVNFKLSKFIKVEEIDVAQVIGCVENKICLYIFFMKNKLRNKLIDCLNLIVCMFSQKLFPLESFVYNDAIHAWKKAKKRYNYTLEC